MACHADAESFDVNGTQTEIKGVLEELHTIFVDKKCLNPETDLWGVYDTAHGKFSNPSADAPSGRPKPSPTRCATYQFVPYDASMGVHDSSYAKAILEAALER